MARIEIISNKGPVGQTLQQLQQIQQLNRLAAIEAGVDAVQSDVTALQASVDALTEVQVLYDATWDFVGTMVAEEDVEGSGNWYWGGYNAEADDAVFWDYGWTVAEYDDTVFELITEEHDKYEGAFLVGLPVYIDNTGKILDKTLILEVSSVGYHTEESPLLAILANGYVNIASDPFTVNSVNFINYSDTSIDTFDAQQLVDNITNTAFEIEAVGGNTYLFYLDSGEDATGGSSFTITSPIRVRILKPA